MAPLKEQPVQADGPLPPRISRDLEKASEIPEQRFEAHDHHPESGEPGIDRKLLKWNASWAITFKSLATFYGLLLLGLNDAVYGVCFLFIYFSCICQVLGLCSVGNTPIRRYNVSSVHISLCLRPSHS